MDLQKDGDAAVQHRVLEPARPAPARHHPYAREGSEKANGRLEARPVSPAGHDAAEGPSTKRTPAPEGSFPLTYPRQLRRGSVKEI